MVSASVSRLGTPAGVFVGRQTELAVIADAFAEARCGVPGVIWVEGDPGVGKTSLLERGIAAMPGAEVLRVGGDEAEEALPFGVVDQLAARLPRGTVEQFPLIRPGHDSRVDPLTVGADLLGALGALGGDAPTVVVVDDVQWVDGPSVGALVFALRRLHHDRVLVLMGARSEGTGDDRWDRLLSRGHGVRRLRLGGLAAPELSGLAAAMGRPLGATSAAERLWEHTRGHPLHARTLLEELAADTLAASTPVLPAPRSLAAVVLVRLSRASPAARAVVVAVSVLGVVCPFSQAAALAGVEDPVGALDDAVDRGLLEERAASPIRLVGFPHPLLRAAVYGDLPPARRRALHRAAAAVVPGRAALAHRVAAAAGADARLAAELETRAGEDLEGPGGGVSVAADHLRWAAELSVDVADRERRLAVAAETLLAGGEISRAAAMEDAVAACSLGARRSQILGQLALLTGRLARARTELEAALRGADTEVGADVRAVASAHLALLEVLQGRPQRAVDLAAAAFAVGRGRDARLPAGFALVFGLAATGRHAEAHAVLDVAAGPAEARTPLHLDALALRGVLAAIADDDRVAVDVLSEVVGRARAGEPVRLLPAAMSFLAVARHRRGELADADAGAELAVTLARDGGMELAGPMARAVAAQLSATRGRPDEAREHLATAAGAGPSWWGAELSLGVAGAVVARAVDDPAGMLTSLEPLRRPEARALADGLGMLAVRSLEAEALLGLGRLDDAAEALSALDARLDGQASTRCAIEAARLHARLAEERGQPANARAAAAAGLALTATSSTPLETALLEAEHGRRLVAEGDRRGGVDLLRSARERLRRCGATPFLARCDALLHAAGLTPSPAEDALGLTPHEEAVAALVARGLTNREVGRDLFVTPRTVAYHLSNVYAKLGVSSRRELRDLIAARRGGAVPS